MGQAAPPGVAVALAQRVAQRALWTRVQVQRTLGGTDRPLPAPMPPTDVLRTQAQWHEAVAECRRLRLPRHPDRPKNWAALGAVATVLDVVGSRASVLDAGGRRYSPILPWLRLYGCRDLVGDNPRFGVDARRDGVLLRYADITVTDFPDGRFDAVTCMNVIEQGAGAEAFLAESARILRPGGVLIVSTDYDQQPPATTGRQPAGRHRHIFSPEEINALIATAAAYGLTLRGELAYEHPERPVHRVRAGLDHTFIRLTFDRG